MVAMSIAKCAPGRTFVVFFHAFGLFARRLCPLKAVYKCVERKAKIFLNNNFYSSLQRI